MRTISEQGRIAGKSAPYCRTGKVKGGDPFRPHLEAVQGEDDLADPLIGSSEDIDITVPGVPCQGNRPGTIRDNGDQQLVSAAGGTDVAVRHLRAGIGVSICNNSYRGMIYTWSQGRIRHGNCEHSWRASCCRGQS